jgi:hypothetical protein
MNRVSTKRGIVVTGVTAACLAGLTGAADAGGAEPQSRRSKRGDGTEAQAYGFVYAVRRSAGFEVFGANGEAFPWCGSYALRDDAAGLGPHCRVTSIDFGPMGLPSEAASAVLADVGTYDEARAMGVRLLFAGKVTNGVLQVWETWRSPDFVPTSSPLYAVSHADPQTLVLNTWSKASLGTLDFETWLTPKVAQCYTTIGGTCPASDADWAAPEMQVRERAGIVLTGIADRRGTFYPRHYFLLVSTGHTQSNDGYSYCVVGQSFCGDHQCTFTPPSCPATHGRIRGLVDYPNPNTDPTFQDWQVATGQLTQSDVAPSN